MKSLALLILSLSLALAGSAAAKPNVVLILADDLGYGDVACYAETPYQTPQIDRMAAEGIRLTRFVTPMPYCAPTRASLMTGRYPSRCGLVSNPAPDFPAEKDPARAREVDQLGLPEGEVTLAQLFRDAGYVTACIGKWHLGHQPDLLPTRRGFDEYFGIPYSNDMRPVRLLENEAVFEEPVQQATLTKRYTERALSFFEKNREKPFFLYLAHAMPHKPLAASEDFLGKSGAGLYGDVITELDWSVGEILSKLEKLGLEENTLVFFTSDNGPWYGGSTGGLREMKGSTFEGGYRVPMIARWPGTIPAGQTSEAPAIMMDLFATSLAAAKIRPPGDRAIDGKDLLPFFRKESAGPHEILFGQTAGDLATVRSGPWKLVLRPHPKVARTMRPDEPWIDPRAPDGTTILAPAEQYHPSQYPGLLTGDMTEAPMLFDLDADPGEQHNVAAEHPDVVRSLQMLRPEGIQFPE